MDDNKTYEQLLADNRAKEDIIAKLIDENTFLKQALTQKLDNYRDCLEILNLIARYNARERLSTLSNREIEVLQYIGYGFCNKEIAGILGIEILTIKTHRNSIRQKLNIPKTGTLECWAYISGLIVVRLIPKDLLLFEY